MNLTLAMVLQRSDIPQQIETEVRSRNVSTQTTMLPFKIFECDVCGRILSTNFNLRRHMKNYHNDSRVKTKSQQQCHNSVSKNSQRPLHCPQAGVAMSIEDPANARIKYILRAVGVEPIHLVALPTSYVPLS